MNLRLPFSRRRPTRRVHRRYPFTSVFAVYCFVTLLVAVGAFNASNNLLFWLFGLALGLLIVSGFVSGIMMMALRVERVTIEQPVVGRPMRVRYRVRNTSRLMPTFGLAIREQFDAPLVLGGGVRAQRSATLDEAPAAHVVTVPRDSSVEVEGVAMPLTRGMCRLAGFSVLTAFPFGIIRKSLWHEEPASAVVHPAHVPAPAEVFERAKGRGAIGDSSQTIGRHGQEFMGLRDYAPGDPPKVVAWRSSARLATGQLLVKQTATGTPRRLWVVLELRRDVSSEEREHAIAVAAGFLRGGAERRMSVGLSVTTDWGAGLEAPPGSPVARSQTLMNELALLPDPADTDASTPLHAAARAGRRTGDIIIEIDTRGRWSLAGSSGGGLRSRAGHEDRAVAS